MAQLTVQIVTHDEEFRKQVATMVRACGVPVGITEGRSTIEGAGPDLVVVDIRDGVLLVVCHASADMSLLRMTIDVVVAGWRNDPAIDRQLRQRAVARDAAIMRRPAESAGPPVLGLFAPRPSEAGR